jgi:hypothetical protein
MRYAFAAAMVLAVVFACGGSFTSGNSQLNLLDAGLGGGSPVVAPDAGDGGLAGDAGDSGTGVACAATGFANPQVLDGCDNSGVFALASVQFNQNCTAVINWGGSAAPCVGNISGANDAFDGGCTGLGLSGCTSTSLPGTITCPTASGTCNIVVCSADAGGCN